ncbi:MAG: hypothetical protein H6766_04205 [Candidatus Peribacteria bacterium]|nr:MAG: hypothetical protein H6766_04205 [Candidatus Peribacteria bacterium]
MYKFVQEGDKWTNASDMEISQSGDEYILHIVGANAYQVFASQGEDIVPWRMVRYTIHNADYALSYDDEGYLTTITDPHGRNIIFSYEELNPSYPEKRLTHIAHANGRSVDITYYGDQDSDGVLGDIASFVVNHENQNQTINLTYNSDVRYDSVTGERVVNHLLSHQLATIDDNKDNIYVDNTYDAHDRVIQQAYGDQILSYTYTDLADGNLQVDITDRRGQTATHVYDAYYRLLSLTDQSGIMYHYEYDGI